MSKLDNLRRPRVDVPKRRLPPKAVRDEVWARDRGRCIRCGATDRLNWEHRVSRALGGQDDVSNIDLLCDRESCHRQKTKTDITAIARAVRLEKKDLGEKTKTRHPVRSAGFRKDGPKRKIQSRGFEKR